MTGNISIHRGFLPFLSPIEVNNASITPLTVSLLWEATRRFRELGEIAYLNWLEETIQMVENQF